METFLYKKKIELIFVIFITSVIIPLDINDGMYPSITSSHSVLFRPNSGFDSPLKEFKFN